MTDQADDGWGVADDYEIYEFYTRGSDGRGHSDNMRVRLKPDVFAEIAALISSGVIPDYDTPQAMIRDAIVHRLHWLSTHMDDATLRSKLAESVRRHVVEENTQRYVQLITGFEEFLQTTRDLCEKALRFNDHRGLDGHLEDLRLYASDIREPYSMMLREVEEYYTARVDRSELQPDVPLDGGIGPEGETE